METVSAHDASKLSIRRRKCESPLLRASHQSFAAGKSRIESTLERYGRFGALDHDRVIVLALVAGCGKVRGALAEQPRRSAACAPRHMVRMAIGWVSLRACFSQNLRFGKRGRIYASRQQGHRHCGLRFPLFSFRFPFGLSFL